MKLLIVLSVLMASGVVVAGDTSVTLSLDEDAKAVNVQIAGKPFTVYEYSSELPKPFLSPVRGPEGTIISRPIGREGDDHPHHKGIWVAVDEVNEVDFWAERGKIQNVSVKILSAEGDPARLAVMNHWLDADGDPVVTEKTNISFYSNRLIAYDITFVAEEGDVTFRDTKEGLFGFRMVDSMREREGGHVVNADGKHGTTECWGQTSDWVDYYGQVDGKTLGITIFDHPENLRRSRYHVRNYGLFSISPFGESAYTGGEQEASPVTIDKGSELRLRYAMYVHPGDTESAQVAETYRQYLEGSR